MIFIYLNYVMAYELKRRPTNYFKVIRPFSKKIEWKSVVGLEVHAQINSASKLFSASATRFAAPVNSSVSLFDAAVPGTLPNTFIPFGQCLIWFSQLENIPGGKKIAYQNTWVLQFREALSLLALQEKLSQHNNDFNRVMHKSVACVEMGVLTALALSCSVNAVSMFDRKHYFYADLPAGYQITQQRSPLAQDGVLSFHVLVPGANKPSYTKSSRIKQLQLEQDSGKSLHDDINHRSLVDLNRSGIPLMELVFEPDLTDGEEAAALIKELVLILTRLNTCTCRMEEGALRVDANVSMSQEGSAQLGVRSEVKNIGSVRGVANAIAFEIQRQRKILSEGGTVVNETRSWDALSGVTVPMRDKEHVQDYRFMPEPNLPPLRLEMNADVSKAGLVCVPRLRTMIPELPEEARANLHSEYNLSPHLTFVLVNNTCLLNYFRQIISEKPSRSANRIASFLVIQVLFIVYRNDTTLEDSGLKASTIGELIDLLESGQVNLGTAERVLKEVAGKSSHSPSQIVEMKGWTQITDIGEIKKLCEDAITSNTKAVKQYKAGKEKVFNFLVGCVAKKTDGLANMSVVDKTMREMLDQK